MMKRRKFLQSGSILTLPLMLGGMEVSALTNSGLFNIIDGDSDKVLVLIQLNGGNDGLNTVIPLNQYDNLVNARPNVIIPQNDILPFTDTNGLHPNLSGMKALYDDARMSLVQGVGYPDQNRSHFRSTDIWTTGSSSDEFLTSGWLGRFMNLRYPGYPDGYPNDENPDPFAITLGYIVSETCQGISSNYSIALNNPEELSQIEETVEGNTDNSCYGMELKFIRDSIKQTNAYSDSVSTAYDQGNNLASYDQENPLARQLQIVAKLVSGGSKTKIYVVSLGGFDTHADQVVGGETTTGVHADLLKYLSDAAYSFQTDLKMLGCEERVLSMTFSEFGRRIASNFSNGTDHGSAAPLFIFGKCINPAIIGDNPEIAETVDSQEGVAMQYDFRSVYASVLKDWFDASEDEIRDVLFDDFQYIPIINSCTSVNTEDVNLEFDDIRMYPNPAINFTSLNLSITESTSLRIALYDVLGHRVKVVSERLYKAGDHQIDIDLHDFITGNYVVEILTPKGRKAKILSVVK